MKTAVVVVADEKYLPAACCTVISCRRAGRVTEPIFVLVNSASDNSIEAARQFLNERGAAAEIICFHQDLSGYRNDRWISAASNIRLHLDEVMESTWQRVLYLDADTRVLAPLAPLLQIDLAGRVLGAVDQCIDLDGRVLGVVDQCGNNPDYLQRLSMAPDSRYFNSGVLLFDWPAILSSGLLAQSRRFAAENPQFSKFLDQDALNNVFEGLWQPLNVRWNYGHRLMKRFPRERAFIKHYTYQYKPWGPRKRPVWIADAFWYWYILRGSPWPDFAHPITFRDLFKAARWWLSRIRSSESLSHRFSDDGLRRESTRNTSLREG